MVANTICPSGMHCWHMVRAEPTREGGRQKKRCCWCGEQHWEPASRADGPHGPYLSAPDIKAADMSEASDGD